MTGFCSTVSRVNTMQELLVRTEAVSLLPAVMTKIKIEFQKLFWRRKYFLKNLKKFNWGKSNNQIECNLYA